MRNTKINRININNIKLARYGRVGLRVASAPAIAGLARAMRRLRLERAANRLADFSRGIFS